MRLGWFRPVHCKSMAAQEVRALLTARKLVQIEAAWTCEMSLRGILRGFGLKVGTTTPTGFAGRISELVAGHANLGDRSRRRCFRCTRCCCASSPSFEKRVRSMARVGRAGAAVDVDAGRSARSWRSPMLRRSTIPARFKSSKGVGAHFGLTPKKYQSGETDITGRISKIGDAAVRTALYEAAHIILTQPVKGCTALKSWAMRLARRAGMKKAKVALARKLAVILHRMLVDGTPFERRWPPRRPDRGGDQRFSGGPRHQPSRSEVPRRDDGSGQTAMPG